VLYCKVEGGKQEQKTIQTGSLVGRLKPEEKGYFIGMYSQCWDRTGYLLLCSRRRGFITQFLLLRLLMQTQITSEVRASSIPCVTVGLGEVLRRYCAME